MATLNLGESERPWKPGSESLPETRGTLRVSTTEAILVIPRLPEEVLVYETPIPNNKA